jgi:hypothetical protein
MEVADRVEVRRGSDFVAQVTDDRSVGAGAKFLS